MKLIRTFFVLLLCAMLPLTGLAASGLAGPCPMQMAMSNDTGTPAQAMSGCCDDMMKSPCGDHGKKSGNGLCKMTAQCRAGSLYYPVSLSTLFRPAGQFRPVRFHYAEAFPFRSPDGLWRPPRAV